MSVLLDSSVFDDICMILINRNLRIIVEISLIGEEDPRPGATCQILDRNDTAMFKTPVRAGTPLQAIAFALTEAIRTEKLKLADERTD